VKGRFRFLLLPFLVVLAGCAAPPMKETALPVAPPAPLEGRWHVVYFSYVWPKKSPPRWQLDTLIAHRVIAPVLKRYQQRVALWRFHRRAARDGAGHRLRFMFYAEDKVAASVIREVKTASLLCALQAGGWVKRVSDGDFGAHSERVSATSDPRWPTEVQNTWPYYIMGVSRAWLELIASVEGGRTRSISDAATLVRRYQRIDDEVSRIWRDFGQHAYVHHLSGVYGYKPLEVRY
jgi:hypothetical protein